MPENPAGREHENLSASIARGSAWMMLFKLIERTIGFVSTLILARVLVPADFGLVAMAMSVVALTELMGAFGFDIALIQRKVVNRTHYDTAWTYNVFVGAVIALILLAIATPVASFYREPRLLEIMPVLALSTFIQSFSNIGTVAFRKELNFRREFAFMLSKKIFSFAVTMVMAFTFRSYWALIGGSLAGGVFGVIASYALHPFRPRFSLAASKDLFNFSKWLLANNFIFFVQNRSTDFILGRTMGAHTLGVYNIAFEIATLPSTELVAPLNRAALPGYAKIADDLVRLRQAFLRMIGIIAIFVIPVGVGLASVADPAVRLLLGPKWVEAIPLIQILAVFGTVNALQSNAGQIYFALGIPKVITLMAGGALVFMFPAIYFASIHYGAVGAALVFFVTSSVMTPIVHLVFFRLVGMHASEYFSVIWRAIAGSIVMAIIVMLTRAFIPTLGEPVPALLELGICIVVGSVSFASTILVLWHLSGRPAGAEQLIIDTIISRFNKFRSVPGAS